MFWCIVTVFKEGYQVFQFGYGCEIPEVLADWVGNTELTTLDPLEFVEVIEELEAALHKMGRWAFAEEYCDPREVERAQKELARKRAAG